MGAAAAQFLSRMEVISDQSCLAGSITNSTSIIRICRRNISSSRSRFSKC
jgi:hypothetical protein